MTSAVKAGGGGVEERPVELTGPVSLAGVLRVPAGATRPLPALVLTGPFTGVKEQVVGTYARALAAAGFVTLAFDHRGFGASDGQPRQHEDGPGKLEDLRLATSFLAAREEVDPTRLGCVGICLGGGYALRHSASDRRVQALAVIAGGFNDPAQMQQGIGADGYRELMTSFSALDQEQHDTGTVQYVAAVSDDPAVEAVMAGEEPHAYYGTERSSTPNWVNQVTRLSVRTLLTVDLAGGADFLGPTPALVVHGRTDNFCSPAGAQAIYDRLTGPKDLMWLDTSNHIDLYDQPAYVDPAVDRVAGWMTEHLVNRS